MVKLIIILILFIIIPSEAYASNAGLSWDANTQPDLAGYKVYYGTATGVYDTNIDVGNVLCRLWGQIFQAVPSTGVYYFVATAYDTSANESDYSNEVSYDFSQGYDANGTCLDVINILWHKSHKTGRQRTLKGGFQ